MSEKQDEAESRIPLESGGKPKPTGNTTTRSRRRIIVILVVVAVVVVVAVTVGLIFHFVTQKDDDTSSTAAEKQHEYYGFQDCWVGSQCDSCNNDYTGEVNGIELNGV